MFANKDPWEKARRLFGVVSGYDCSAPSEVGAKPALDRVVESSLDGVLRKPTVGRRCDHWVVERPTVGRFSPLPGAQIRGCRRGDPDCDLQRAIPSRDLSELQLHIISPISYTPVPMNATLLRICSVLALCMLFACSPGKNQKQQETTQADDAVTEPLWELCQAVASSNVIAYQDSLLFFYNIDEDMVVPFHMQEPDEVFSFSNT